jgi:hypothetical protein
MNTFVIRVTRVDWQKKDYLIKRLPEKRLPEAKSNDS